MHDPDDVAGLLRRVGLRDVSSTVLTTTLTALPTQACSSIGRRFGIDLTGLGDIEGRVSQVLDS